MHFHRLKTHAAPFEKFLWNLKKWRIQIQNSAIELSGFEQTLRRHLFEEKWYMAPSALVSSARGAGRNPSEGPLVDVEAQLVEPGQKSRELCGRLPGNAHKLMPAINRFNKPHVL